MAITQHKMTLEEFLALPEEKPALELEPNGTVVQKVSPQGQHSALQLALGELISAYARPRRLARAFTDLRASYGGASYVPDVSVYRWERIPRTTEGEIDNVFRAPPDIAIEIVSPEQSVNALVRRCRWYAGNGVERALLVDPAGRSVLLVAPRSAPRALAADEPIDFGTVLPGFTLTVSELFNTLRLD
jgi:Uma2 family endonuclease